jgi:hypothetical protein
LLLYLSIAVFFFFFCIHCEVQSTQMRVPAAHYDRLCHWIPPTTVAAPSSALFQSPVPALTEENLVVRFFFFPSLHLSP